MKCSHALIHWFYTIYCTTANIIFYHLNFFPFHYWRIFTVRNLYFYLDKAFEYFPHQCTLPNWDLLIIIFIFVSHNMNLCYQVKWIVHVTVVSLTLLNKTRPHYLKQPVCKHHKLVLIAWTVNIANYTPPVHFLQCYLISQRDCHVSPHPNWSSHHFSS